MDEHSGGGSEGNVHEARRHSCPCRRCKNAWDTRLSEKAFKNVYERLQNVLVMIDDDKGGNAKVEEKRGKLFRKLELRDDSASDVDEG